MTARKPWPPPSSFAARAIRGMMAWHFWWRWNNEPEWRRMIRLSVRHGRQPVTYLHFSRRS